jgi:hypothetical protein
VENSNQKINDKIQVCLNVRISKKKHQVFKTALTFSNMSLVDFIENAIDDFLSKRPNFKKILDSENLGKDETLGF